MTPTAEQTKSYQVAFDYFNQQLFDKKLPFAYLNFSRKSGALGLFTPSVWRKEKDTIHEISLNPDLLDRPPENYMSTLVHEMCHHWQQIFGQPSRNGYHNIQWAGQMIQVGLIPSNTGLAGGKMTGQQMTHYVEVGGKFETAFKSLPKDALLPWTSSNTNNKPKIKQPPKLKYICPSCEQLIWSLISDLDAACNECSEDYVLFKDWKNG